MQPVLLWGKFKIKLAIGFTLRKIQDSACNLMCFTLPLGMETYESLIFWSLIAEWKEKMMELNWFLCDFKTVATSFLVYIMYAWKFYVAFFAIRVFACLCICVFVYLCSAVESAPFLPVSGQSGLTEEVCNCWYDLLTNTLHTERRK